MSEQLSQTAPEEQNSGFNPFSSLTIRVKLTLVIGAILIATFAVVLFVVTAQQQRVLTRKTTDLCKILAQNLSAAAKENLLLESSAPIQEAIANIEKKRIEGVKELAVVDRNENIVAHSDVNSIGQEFLLSTDSTTTVNAEGQTPTLAVFETVSEYIYIDSIFIRKSASSPNVFLGFSAVRFSKETLHKPIEEQRNAILQLGAAVLLASIVIVFLMSTQIVAAIVNLSKAARKVGEGDFSVRVPVKSKDELGELSGEFNRMVKQVRERTEMQRFVSDIALKMIQESENISLGGERRFVAIFFSDVRGFTSMSEKLEPEKVVEIINIYHTLQTDVIQKYGGSIDKFVGDGIMAIFIGDKLADRAVQAAVEIQSKIGQMNAARRAAGELAPEVGIGINIGYAVLGNIGARNRMDFTAVGDTVNLASRLCSIAPAGKVIVSEAVTRELTAKYHFGEKQAVSVKGKAATINVFTVEECLEDVENQK